MIPNLIGRIGFPWTLRVLAFIYLALLIVDNFIVSFQAEAQFLTLVSVSVLPAYPQAVCVSSCSSQLLIFFSASSCHTTSMSLKPWTTLCLRGLPGIFWSSSALVGWFESPTSQAQFPLPLR